MPEGIVIYGTGNKVKTELVLGNATTYIFPESEMVSEDTVKAMLNEGRENALIATIGINKPIISLPTPNATNFNGFVTTSEYSVAGTYRGSHDSSDFELSYDKDFLELVDSSYNTTTLLSHTFTLEKPNTLHYIRCRHNSGSFKGAWSDTVMVTSVNAYVVNPVIALVEESKPEGIKYSLPGTPFESVNIVGQTHKTTRYVVSNDPEFKDILLDVRLTALTDVNLGKGEPLNLEVIPGHTYYVKVKYIGSYYNSGWSNTVKIVGSVKTQIPLLSGPLYTTENSVIKIGILNHNVTFNYSVFVDIGAAAVKGNSIEWTIPFVDVDVLGTLVVTAEDAVNGSEVSSQQTHIVSILNRSSISDAMLRYDGANISAAFLKTLASTVSGTIDPRMDSNIMNVHFVSDKDTYWINNRYTEMFKGDVLTDNNGDDVIVKEVGDGGINRADIGTYSSTYWIVPENSNVPVPSKLYLKHGRATSVVVTQEATEKDFVGIGAGTLIEKVATILVSDPSNSKESFIVNDTLVTPYIGMVVCDQGNEVRKVKTYNKTTRVITIDTPFTIIPTAVYSVSNLRLNAVELELDTVTVIGTMSTVTFRAKELANVRTLRTTIDIPYSNEVISVSIPVNKAV